jgi:hypothetical protein
VQKVIDKNSGFRRMQNFKFQNLTSLMFFASADLPPSFLFLSRLLERLLPLAGAAGDGLRLSTLRLRLCAILLLTETNNFYTE